MKKNDRQRMRIEKYVLQKRQSTWKRWQLRGKIIHKFLVVWWFNDGQDSKKKDENLQLQVELDGKMDGKNEKSKSDICK